MMKLDLNVNVHHLSRVEGHGNIHIRVQNGELKHASWEVVETPRFFEVMLKGRKWDEAGILTARICGICSIGHCLASVRATENAFGTEVPAAAGNLRLLAKHGETLQSHYLHLFFLAAPDFLGLPSAIPLIDSQPQIVGIAVRLKGLANRLCDLVAGRTTHPVSIHVGGMARMPDRRKLLGLRDELVRSVEDVDATIELFRKIEIPEFIRETEFVSLKGDGDYPFIGGDLISTDGVIKPEALYREMTNEFAVDHSTSKWCKLSRNSFAVGALARVNNNYALLRPEAQAVARQLNLAPVNHNPFMNNIAQLVECVHCTYESIDLIDSLAGLPEGEPTKLVVEPRAGIGVGAVEVPRGILYHEYEYGSDGRVVRANCVIPTTQNHANIQDDLTVLVKQFSIKGLTDSKMELLSSMLVRAYDPCISCSVH
jgi:coenzyme F420-reducing hydrogenase alpha subunit